MKFRKRNFKKDKGSENFWPAFTDMISTIALILFFLMLLAYIQNIITGKNLEFAKKQIIDTQKRLEESNAEISQAEKRLRLLRDKLEDVKAEVERGEIALKLSEEQIEDQKKIIAESNRELGELRTKLRGVAVLRLEVLEKVKRSVENELGKTNDQGEELVLISDNGNIVINEGLLFDSGESDISNDGKELLAELSVAFEKVLDDSDVRANIDAITIQGHADKKNTGIYNRQLSSERAYKVVNEMMRANEDLQEKYGRYFAATGYSEYRPVASGDSPEALAKNRRIEISITLKDSHVQDVIDEYLEESIEVFNEQSE